MCLGRTIVRTSQNSEFNNCVCWWLESLQLVFEKACDQLVGLTKQFPGMPFSIGKIIRFLGHSAKFALWHKCTLSEFSFQNDAMEREDFAIFFYFPQIFPVFVGQFLWCRRISLIWNIHEILLFSLLFQSIQKLQYQLQRVRLLLTPNLLNDFLFKDFSKFPPSHLCIFHKGFHWIWIEI